ncbi:MAG: histone deacetylase [Marinobacter sp.]|nr:histone deacetylase [Marinobacter sp.]
MALARLPSLLYSPNYDISLPGLDFLHPFDGKKYSKALQIVRKALGDATVADHLHIVERGVSDEELAAGHSDFYIGLTKHKVPVCRALELMPLRFLPQKLIDNRIVLPMRYATYGTVLATQKALDTQALAINIGGGYHHASPGHGEGFCLFSDVTIAVNWLREKGILNQHAKVGIIDLDAHQGQGFAISFRDDDSVRILDAYNADVYPRDKVAKGFTTTCLEFHTGCQDEEYLSRLREALPAFLDEQGPFDLVYYNAGTDIVAGDKLGAMAITEQGVLERDRMVLDALAARNIPTVMLASGGYTAISHKLIAATIIDRFSNVDNKPANASLAL